MYSSLHRFREAKYIAQVHQLEKYSNKGVFDFQAQLVSSFHHVSLAHPCLRIKITSWRDRGAGRGCLLYT